MESGGARASDKTYLIWYSGTGVAEGCGRATILGEGLWEAGEGGACE